MPPYIVQPTVQPYPPVSIRGVMTGFPCHSFGKFTPYADAPDQFVSHPEVMPVDGTAGAQFATRQFQGQNQNSPAITWQTILTGAGSVDIRLQGALIDQDSDYFDLDKSTNPAGETRTVGLGQTRVNFLRIKVVSSLGTGGGSPPDVGTINAFFIL